MARATTSRRRSGMILALAAAVAAHGAVMRGAAAQQAQAPAPPAPAQPQAQPRFALPAQPELEAKALEILQAASARLAAAKSLGFTATATYESPARTGLMLSYATQSRVLLQRPDKLAVITPGDGPPTEFYYDGKTMTAYMPEAKMAAVAEAPPTIDAMLQTAYAKSATYFPFTDVIVADPYADLLPGLRLAFVMGRSRVVGGVTTDIVVVANEIAQAQIWIGAEDRLPRRIEAQFFQEGGYFRHTVELSDWRLDPPIQEGAFAPADPAGTKRIPFAPPGAPLGGS